MMTLMKGTSPGLALITPLIPATPEEEVCMDSMNVSALSLLLGKTLRLSQEDTLTLGLGAQLHQLGMQRIPTALRAEKRASHSFKRNGSGTCIRSMGGRCSNKFLGCHEACWRLSTSIEKILRAQGFLKGYGPTTFAISPGWSGWSRSITS